MSNKVIIAGAGPGAEDLITLRAANALKKADLVIYAGSLINPAILNLCGGQCEKFNSAGMDLHEVVAKIEKAVRNDEKVVRLHSGDPAMYGAIAEQMRIFDEKGIDYEIIPGVTCAFAAAAALKCEYTLPGVTQSLVLTRRAGRTPVPEKESLKYLAANDASIVLFLSIGDIDGVVRDFLDAGRSEDTPVAVVYRASWPNQKILRGTLNDIAAKVKEAQIKRQALVIVGKALSRQGDESLLYDKSFAHGYRSNRDASVSRTPSALYAITEQGIHKAFEIAGGLDDASVFIPERFAEKFPNAKTFEKGRFDSIIENNWKNFEAHIFVMAAGIVVRKIAPFIDSKLTDPAVVVCDELGSHAISLLSGHIGGANRLAELIAGITGGKAVVTTATDVNNMTAFDELAMLESWRVLNPENIKILNSMLLQAKNIDMLIPEDVFKNFYKNTRGLRLVSNPKEITGDAVVSLDRPEVETDIPHLKLSSKIYCLGIGCRKETSLNEIEVAVLRSLAEKDIDINQIAALGSADLKRNETGLVEFAKKYSLKTEFFTKDELNSRSVPNPSKKAKELLGINSVAEAAALLLSGNDKLTITKTKYGKVTVALAALGYSANGGRNE